MQELCDTKRTGASSGISVTRGAFFSSLRMLVAPPDTLVVKGASCKDIQRQCGCGCGCGEAKNVADGVHGSCEQG